MQSANTIFLFYSGNLGACHVRLENPAHPVRYRGVVCSMKESFGFIERADVVKEIFFHFSEAKSMKDELRLGDDVEFIIQTRNVSSIITAEIGFNVIIALTMNLFNIVCENFYLNWLIL